MRNLRSPVRVKQLAAAALLTTAILWPVAASAQVAVRYTEGAMHGFLVLRTMDGKAIADGDLIQSSRGNRITARLTFHFKDGSVHDETAIYTQSKHLQLVSEHLVQKGPAFPQPVDMSIDGASGQVSVHYTDEHGKQKTETQRMDIPPDLANGIIPKVLMNAGPSTVPNMVSMIAATPKPRLVKIAITPAGQDSFSIGGSGRKANHYVLKVELGGVAGFIAPLIGKEPPDAHIWIMGGDVPAFVKSEQPLYAGGPMWRIELTSPVWPRTPAETRTASAAK
jgi:hypothetical protein